MNINDTHYAAPQEGTDGEAEFAEQFEELLAKSSLGAANARAVRELTPTSKVGELLDIVENADADHKPGRRGDADKALLTLVRTVATGFPGAEVNPDSPAESDTPVVDSHPPGVSTTAAADAAVMHQSERPRGKSVWSLGAVTSWGMLLRLAEADVFRYVRRDIARLVLEAALKTTAPPELARLTNGAIESSRLADELVEALLYREGVPTDSGSHPGSNPELDDLIVEGSTMASSPSGPLVEEFTAESGRTDPPEPCRAQFLLMRLEAPVEMRDEFDRARTIRQNRLDELAREIARFIRHAIDVATAAPGTPVRGDDAGAEPGGVDLASALILASLYEGPKNTQALQYTIRAHLGLSEFTEAELKERVRMLYRRRLISKAGRPAVNSPSPMCFRLTGMGGHAFAEWLSRRPDRDRIKLVSRILKSPAFSHDQRVFRFIFSDEHSPDDRCAQRIRTWFSVLLTQQSPAPCSCAQHPTEASRNAPEKAMGER
ncbi:hypothetical protein GCM10010492_10040 [Saccharothrix mutabilis subsp. mutabilis]|uniref:DUF222 domain-containing protein n=1 Tax=Saccharothrix mutabilis subsp. mutabilis TaxID=66855 RepID=A0ABN0T716_9PSEU